MEVQTPETCSSVLCSRDPASTAQDQTQQKHVCFYLNISLINSIQERWYNMCARRLLNVCHGSCKTVSTNTSKPSVQCMHAFNRHTSMTCSTTLSKVSKACTHICLTRTFYKSKHRHERAHDKTYGHRGRFENAKIVQSQNS